MKIPITLTIDEDLKKLANKKDIVISNLLREALIKATRDPSKESIKNKFEIKEYVCSWCKEHILEDYYFVCYFHKSIFCENCAINGGKRTTNTNKDGRRIVCLKNFERVDCVLEKKMIKEVKDETRN